MRLSWNEIRARASAFAREWAGETYEKGETQSFYNDFFEIFGVRRRTVARYEEHVRRLDNTSGYIDLFWPGVLIVEHKSAGRDLAVAREQAGSYFDALPERDRPRYQLLSDFRTFELLDRDEREEIRFRLEELPQNIESFGFVLGVQRRTFRDHDPVNIEAAALVGKLRDLLYDANYRGSDLERFLVRIAFCLFADDTGIFESRDIFYNLIVERTAVDGVDLGLWIAMLFQVLNTPIEQRMTTLDDDLAQFPYVDGDLFRDTVQIASFNSSMRRALIDACRFDWSAISPAIFGALFQSVMDTKQRREQGAHYTTEKNILKVIEPLFMDNLRAEFRRLKARKDSRRTSDLHKFQRKLGSLHFLDPACGCGNFLVIAYRELRLLELDVLRELRDSGQSHIDVSILSMVDVDQFHGIELNEFPARIAETALWMMDHLMNNRLSLEFGQTFARIPLQAAPTIRHGDALELDWNSVLPSDLCSFVLGNPPFGGSKFQSDRQRAQVRRVAALGGCGGTLDYVAAWFIRAGEYVRDAEPLGGKHAPRIGFVTTNSITQGEQVAQLWPTLLERERLEIAFAHRMFAWGSDAPGKAHVHVVIIGLDMAERVPRRKRLFAYPDVKGEPTEISHRVVTPYLLDGARLTDPHLVVREISRPINGMRRLLTGSKPIDNGFFIFNPEERSEFLKLEPKAAEFMRPFVGAREYLHNGRRWILALQNASPTQLTQLPHVRDRIAKVREYRKASTSNSTRKLADTPTLWHINVLPTSPFLVLPEVSSERRKYVPIGWLKLPAIPSNKLRILPDATLLEFALLISSMHMAWMRTVAGRLESRYQYSVGVVYNTFPVPRRILNGRGRNLAKLEQFAQAVLDARAKYPEATLADLYDPDLMPPNLRKAHQVLDRAVDRLYRKNPFRSERERIEHLFVLYEKMQAPLDAARKVKLKKRRGRKGSET